MLGKKKPPQKKKKKKKEIYWEIIYVELRNACFPKILTQKSRTITYSSSVSTLYEVLDRNLINLKRFNTAAIQCKIKQRLQIKHALSETTCRYNVNIPNFVTYQIFGYKTLNSLLNYMCTPNIVLIVFRRRVRYWGWFILVLLQLHHYIHI